MKTLQQVNLKLMGGSVLAPRQVSLKLMRGSACGFLDGRSLAAAKGSWLGEGKVDWLQLWDAHVLRDFILHWGDEWCRRVLSARPGARTHANVTTRHLNLASTGPSTGAPGGAGAVGVVVHEEGGSCTCPCPPAPEPGAHRVPGDRDGSLMPNPCVASEEAPGVGLGILAGKGRNGEVSNDRQRGGDRMGHEAGDGGENSGEEGDVIHVGVVAGHSKDADDDALEYRGKMRCRIPGCNCSRSSSACVVADSPSQKTGGRGEGQAQREKLAREVGAPDTGPHSLRGGTDPSREGALGAEEQGDLTASRLRTPLKAAPAHANGRAGCRSEGVRSAQKIKFTDQEVRVSHVPMV
jgi:hypothetical protein